MWVIDSHGGPEREVPLKKNYFLFRNFISKYIGNISIKPFNIFNFQGVFESYKVARSPKDPPPHPTPSPLE